MIRTLNEAGRNLVKKYESLRLRAYLCPAGVPTIGWGHTKTVTLQDVKEGRTITTDQAELLLDADLYEARTKVYELCRSYPTTDNEYAALVSLCFNIGPAAFAKCSPLRLHLAGQHSAAAKAFGLWVKVRNPQTKALEDSRGLIARRNEEAALYLTSSAAPNALPPPQKIEPEKPLVKSSTMGASAATVVAAGISAGAQISADVAKIREGLGLNAETFAVAAAVVAAGTGAYLMWKRWQGRREGRV